MLRRAQFAKQKIAVFKPEIDNRYSEESVVSHNGTSVIATQLKRLQKYGVILLMILMWLQSMKHNSLEWI